MNSTNKKTIDVVVRYFHPVTAGIETNILETYSILVAQGWSVTVHTSRDTYTSKDSLPAQEDLRGLKIKRYHRSVFGFWPDIDWQSPGVVALHNFDVFPHALIMIRILLENFLAPSSGPALFITPHGGFTPQWSMFSPILALMKYIYHYTVGVWLINKTAVGVRAVSEWERKKMEEKGVHSKLIRVIPNGIESEASIDLDQVLDQAFKDRVAGLGRYLIQIGRIYPIKNYETAIRAMKRVPFDLKLVVVGPLVDQRYRNYLNSIIKGLGLVDRVVFWGTIGGAEKYYLIRQAQAMVHMALWESFCNAVHEGMSQGLVCIVSNRTALPYLVQDGLNGYCLEARDDQALSQKINHVLQDTEDAELLAMRQRNRLIALSHPWSRVAEKMDELYAHSKSVGVPEITHHVE